MENASKALIMAGSVLIAVMIIGAFYMMYNQLTSAKKEEQKSVQIEQVAKFNATFESYNKNNVRGSDLISLSNKIADYNARQANDEKGYGEIIGSVKLNESISIQLSTGTKISLDSNSTFTNIDNYRIKIEETIKEIEKSETIKNTGLSISELSAYLDAGTLNRVVTENTDTVTKYVEDYKKLNDSLLEMKRKKFKCTNVEYSNTTGRITKMEFKEK